MRKPHRFSAALVLMTALLAAAALPGRAQDLKPATVWQPMPDFTLPALQGGDVALSKLKGKNVLLIFPRGLAGENHWCHVCNYQYADLAELEKARSIRKLYNLEVLFVLPYTKEMVEQWRDKFADQMKDIEAWKNPPDADKLDEKGKARVARLVQAFPNRYLYNKGEVPLPFPVLIDADRKVCKGLGVFTTEWGGSKIEQNVPTVFILDARGVVQLKYISQNTFDRPTSEYLLNFISKMGK